MSKYDDTRELVQNNGTLVVRSTHYGKDGVKRYKRTRRVALLERGTMSVLGGQGWDGLFKRRRA